MAKAGNKTPPPKKAEDTPKSRSHRATPTTMTKTATSPPPNATATARMTSHCEEAVGCSRLTAR